MSFINLLKVCHSKQLLQDQMFSLWKSKDDTVLLSKPASNSCLVKFETDTHWIGLIDLKEWFSIAYPELAVLTEYGVPLEKQFSLFLSINKQISLPKNDLYAELNYEKLINVEMVKCSDINFSSLLPSIVGKTGTIWIMQFPENCSELLIQENNKLRWDSVLTFPLSVQLGTSTISSALLKRIKVGDILLINTMDNHIYIDQKPIGLYRFEEGVIMVDLTQNNQIQSEDENDNSMLTSGDAELAFMAFRSQLPVQLTFNLATKNMTIDELDKLYQGQVLPVEQDTYKNIIIKANGLAIAKGEMVVLDNGIGIELTTIFDETKKHVK